MIDAGVAGAAPFFVIASTMGIFVTRLYRAIVALGLGGAMTAAAPPPLTGVWSGERVTLILTPTGGQLDEDCATSTFTGPIRLDGMGAFSATGRHETEGPGPSRLKEDERPIAVTVHLSGRFTRQQLALEVHVAGAPIAQYRLSPGRNFKRVRCL